VFIKGNLTVVLLVDVQVFHQALMQEILKGSGVTEMIKKRQKTTSENQLFKSTQLSPNKYMPKKIQQVVLLTPGLTCSPATDLLCVCFSPSAAPSSL